MNSVVFGDKPGDKSKNKPEHTTEYKALPKVLKSDYTKLLIADCRMDYARPELLTMRKRSNKHYHMFTVYLNNKSADVKLYYDEEHPDSIMVKIGPEAIQCPYSYLKAFMDDGITFVQKTLFTLIAQSPILCRYFLL
jgi:hypothetical protein